MFVNLSLIFLLFGSRYRLPPKPPHIHPGQHCPRIAAHHDPALLKVAVGGEWYVNQVTATSTDAQQFRCVKAEFFSNNTSEGTVKLHGLTYTNYTESSQFSFAPDKVGPQGQFEFFPNLPYNDLNATGIINHKVIGNNSYIIMYTCFILPESKKFCDGAVIFSRQPRLWLRELEELRRDLNRRQEKPVYFRHIFSNAHCEQLDYAIAKQKGIKLAVRKRPMDSDEDEVEEKVVTLKSRHMRVPPTQKCDCEACRNATLALERLQAQSQGKETPYGTFNTKEQSSPPNPVRKMHDPFNPAHTHRENGYPYTGTRGSILRFIRKTTPQPFFKNANDRKSDFLDTFETAQQKINGYLNKHVTPVPTVSNVVPPSRNRQIDSDYTTNREKAFLRKVQKTREQATGRSGSLTRVTSTPSPTRSELNTSSDEPTQKQAREGSSPDQEDHQDTNKNNDTTSRPKGRELSTETSTAEIPSFEQQDSAESRQATNYEKSRASSQDLNPNFEGSKFYKPLTYPWKKSKFPPLPTLNVVKSKDPFGKNIITATFKDDLKPIRSQPGDRSKSYAASSAIWKDERPLSTLKVVKSKDIYGKDIILTTFKDDYDPVQNLLDGKSTMTHFPGNSLSDNDFDRPVIVKPIQRPTKNTTFTSQHTSQGQNQLGSRPPKKQRPDYKHIYKDTDNYKKPDLTQNSNSMYSDDVDRNVLYLQQSLKQDRYTNRNPPFKVPISKNKNKGHYKAQPHTASTKKLLLSPLGNFPQWDENSWKKKQDKKMTFPAKMTFQQGKR